MLVKDHGMMVSGMVGSVAAVLTMGSSDFNETRRAMCVVSPLIDPNMAQSCSSYDIFTISLLEAPQMAESLCTISLNGLPPYPPAALASSIDRKSTRLNSSHLGISYAVFCLKKKH